VDGGLAIENLEESGGTASQRFAPNAKNPQANQLFALARWPRFYLAVLIGVAVLFAAIFLSCWLEYPNLRGRARRRAA
jgi:hypothetical protein